MTGRAERGQQLDAVLGAPGLHAAARPRPRRGPGARWSGSARRRSRSRRARRPARAARPAPPAGRRSGPGRTGSGRPRACRAGSPAAAAPGRRCRRRAPRPPAAREPASARSSSAATAGRAGRLDDQLGPLQAEQQRPRDRRLGHRDDLVDHLLDERERQVARAGRPRSRRPSWPSAPARPAARPPARPGTPPPRSACTPTTRTSGRSALTATPMPATSPPPPVPTSTVRTSGHCSSTSSPTVPCPATMSGWSNGCTSTAPVSGLELPREHQRLVHRPAGQPHLGAVVAGRVDLRQRRARPA